MYLDDIFLFRQVLVTNLSDFFFSFLVNNRERQKEDIYERRKKKEERKIIKSEMMVMEERNRRKDTRDVPSPAPVIRKDKKKEGSSQQW